MTDYCSLAPRLRDTVSLRRRPVAVTDLGDDELSVAIRGKDLASPAAETDTIAGANAAPRDDRRARRQALATE